MFFTPENALTKYILFQVSEVYSKVHRIISQPPVKDYVPFSWVSLTQVKREHYRALAHYYVAVGLLERAEERISSRAEEILQYLHEEEEEEEQDGKRRVKEGKESSASAAMLTEIRCPKTTEERRYLGEDK